MQRYRLSREMVNNGYVADWQTVAKPDPNGSWCLYSDVEDLEGEKKELQSKADAYQSIENLKELGVDSSLIMRAMTRPPQWSKEWPTEPGFYWAYGDFSGRGIDKQLQFVDVVDFLGLLYSANGKTLSPKAHDLAWTPAILPDTSGAIELLEEGES